MEGYGMGKQVGGKDGIIWIHYKGDNCNRND